MKFHRDKLLYRAFAWDLVVILLLVFFAQSCTQKQVVGPGIQVLTYSTLGSKGGFLESVKESFKKESGCELRLETTLGAAQVLSYLEEPKQRDRIDLVMGIDELLFERAKASFYLGEIKNVPYQENLIPPLKSRVKPGFIPMDYGALSFIYRKSEFKGSIKVPTSLPDLLKPELKQKWIVQDPRASSPGMLFFLFTDSILKISQMKHQWVTLAPSWDASYKMFLAKEAPMVWSYVTSLAYHASKGELDQYGYVDFKEGLPVQVEGMAILNHVGDPLKNNPCLEKWIAFVLRPDQQAKLVERQWMMPVISGVKLPKNFESVPELKKIASIPLNLEKVDSLVSHFGKEVQGDSL
ncbi:MAG: thiamine ABC transporter substrate-binding protein [Bdellovibrionales bacterium]|nr:thiamine ABC transporter substrate-binding protein [Oligoflexia bacterium]